MDERIMDETGGNRLYYVSDIISLIVALLCDMFSADELLASYNDYISKYKIWKYGLSPIMGVVSQSGRKTLLLKYLLNPIDGIKELKNDLDNNVFGVSND